MSIASSPRTSPTMIRSGRIRRALMTSCRCLTIPFPSMLGGRVSSRTTCSCRSCSSAASSIVTTRSCAGIKAESTFKSVVLPEPVPPETRIFNLPCTAHLSRSSIVAVSELLLIRSSAVSGSRPKRRMDTMGPSSERGGMITLTREPSCSRASTIGDDSSTRRPTRETIRSMIRIRWPVSLKLTLVGSRTPLRST